MSEKSHYLRPLKGRPVPSRHLLLWVEADESRTRLTATARRAWDFVAAGKGLQAWAAGSWHDADSLESILDRCTKGRGTLTIWICRGWEDLVLTGLAELIDRQACQWRYANLDGHRITVRGQWRGKAIVISSLANWTGNRWDAWPESLRDHQANRMLTSLPRAVDGDEIVHSPGELLAINTLATIFAASEALGCNSVQPSSGAAALHVWRRWLGPRIDPIVMKKDKKGRKYAGKTFAIVAPSPFRPRKSIEAERHSCYGHISRQLVSGHVDGPIYCLDVRSAYLLALCRTVLPLQFRRTLHRPSIVELSSKMAEGTAHALVRIETDQYTYPVRRGRRVFQALGNYWTWIAGHELAWALVNEHVREIYTAYLWHGRQMPTESAAEILGLSDALRRANCPGIVSAWRAVYSSLVGRFACRRKVWEDVPARPGYERWCEWQKSDVQSGRIVQCRSIAGRHQELHRREEASASVPLLFSCVSSFVHYLVQSLAFHAGIDHCYQLVADSLWVDRHGWQALQRRASEVGGAPDNLQCKAVYDRAWFSGKSVCVVEKNGEKYLRSPGVSDLAALDAAGKIERCAATPWSKCDNIDPKKAQKRRKVVFHGQKIIDKYGYPAKRQPLGERLDAPMLTAELLEPVISGRSIIDE